MAPEQPQSSPYYSRNPIFVQTATPAQGSSLKRHRLLVVIAVVVLLAAAALGVWYFRTGVQTNVFGGETPFRQQASPLLQ